MTIIKSPYPWFGGKRKVVDLVWSRLGQVKNYVEPFFGSGAMLLGRPQPFDGVETINDLDGFVSNFWRSIALSPEETAKHAAWPVNENDLHARHAWLVGQKDSLGPKLEGDPEYHDPKIAGWWVWGTCCWIGSGFCSGKGPWYQVDGELINVKNGNFGQGINRQLPHLGDAGQGINRQLPHLGNNGRDGHMEQVKLYFLDLCKRFEKTRVCCGDWSRVCGPSVTHKHGLTAVFLDPPYAANRCTDIYREDSKSVAHDVREWAIENGSNPKMRIALCGYEGEHQMPDDWDCVAWNAGAGFGGQAKERTGNGKKERIWFSPHCLNKSEKLFEAAQ